MGSEMCIRDRSSCEPVGQISKAKCHRAYHSIFLADARGRCTIAPEGRLQASTRAPSCRGRSHAYFLLPQLETRESPRADSCADRRPAGPKEDSAEQYAIAATRKAQFAGSRRARGPKNALAGCQWLEPVARQRQSKANTKISLYTSPHQGLGPGRHSSAARAGRGTTAPRAAATSTAPASTPRRGTSPPRRPRGRSR